MDGTVQENRSKGALSEILAEQLMKAVVTEMHKTNCCVATVLSNTYITCVIQ